MIDTFSGSIVPRDQAEADEDQKRPVSAGSQPRPKNPAASGDVSTAITGGYHSHSICGLTAVTLTSTKFHHLQLKADYNLTVTMTTAVFLNFREMLLRGNECFQRAV